MRRAGLKLCLDGINQTGNEPRLPGIKVGHWILEITILFLSQVDMMGFLFLILSNHCFG